MDRRKYTAKKKPIKVSNCMSSFDLNLHINQQHEMLGEHIRKTDLQKITIK